MSVRHLLPLAACLHVSCGDPGEPDAADQVESPAAELPWDWIPEDPDLASGREIYLAECALCHDEGEEDAPALSRRAEWANRAAKGEDVLTKHALEGFVGKGGEMPARGGSDYLTDQQVINAVRYMIATPK
jgi:cytochrome c5